MSPRAVGAPKDEARNVGVLRTLAAGYLFARRQVPKMLVSMNWLRNLPWGSYCLIRVW